MTLIGGMIRTHRFADFVMELLKIYSDEREDQTLWEFWLHKVYDMTFEDFMNSVQTNKAPINKPSSRAEMEQTVRHSFEMLNNFSL